MRGRHGFTLIEAMLGMMVLLTAASFIAPVFVRDLVLGRLIWERRLAIKVIESQLDQACQLASVSVGLNNDFDDLLVNSGPNAVTNPPELASVGATWTRTVACVNSNLEEAACPTDLKRVRITVNWTSQNRTIAEPQAPVDYLISRLGLCGRGA